MTPNPKKYKKQNEETKIASVTRIVRSENKPMTANEEVACIDKRSMKGVKANKIHTNLSDAVSKYDALCKKRMENDKGQMRVHYYPCDMDVEGEDIPIPAYTKDGGNTFTNEGVDLDDLPDAVKVAEKVLADLGASDDDDAETCKPNPECEECGAFEGGNIDGCDSCNFTYWFNGKVYHPETFDALSPKPTAEEVAKWGEDYDPALGVTRFVKVKGGFVEMQNDIVLGFTTSIVGHLAEALFVEHHVAEQKIIEALNSVNTLGQAELVRALRNLVVNQ